MAVVRSLEAEPTAVLAQEKTGKLANRRPLLVAKRRFLPGILGRSEKLATELLLNSKIIGPLMMSSTEIF
jgi:hypothetical protein